MATVPPSLSTKGACVGVGCVQAPGAASAGRVELVVWGEGTRFHSLDVLLACLGRGLRHVLHAARRRWPVPAQRAHPREGATDPCRG